MDGGGRGRSYFQLKTVNLPLLVCNKPSFESFRTDVYQRWSVLEVDRPEIYILSVLPPDVGADTPIMWEGPTFITSMCLGQSVLPFCSHLLPGVHPPSEVGL